MQLTSDQQAMLDGRHGRARQMGMRLLLDLAATAGAPRLVPIQSAHLSGVSPLTGGLGLRLFLARLAEDPGEGVAVPTTLNSAGCDEAQFPAMRIVEPDFLAHHQEIVRLYASLGVNTIQSCVPYEWGDLLPEGDDGPVLAAWAESNAICFANSYAGFRTNRESGLSALASALTGYAPDYGLFGDEARRPNVIVHVTAALSDPTDFSILGDWVGKQRQPGWKLPFGPIPLFTGLPPELNHEQRKALSAASANYGSPLLYLSESGVTLPSTWQAELTFDEAALRARYEALRPATRPSLVVIGCPQASIGELRAVAAALRGRRVSPGPSGPGQPPPLWIFTSATSRAIAEKTGLADAIRGAGALLLENTCPEVVPYDPTWVHHVLTNSMKAEHYIRSGLNGIPTSVMTLADCIAIAAGEWSFDEEPAPRNAGKGKARPLVSTRSEPRSSAAPDVLSGSGLPSQDDFTVRGVALVTDTPITFLGFVNRQTGVIEEEGHPADGQSMAGKIAIFPRGTGSSVAPYVLLELFYRGVAPIAVINAEIDQQTAPACSLEGIPYAYGFGPELFATIRNGDEVELTRRGSTITLRRVTGQA